jgi:hypothetical protein
MTTSLYDFNLKSYVVISLLLPDVNIKNRLHIPECQVMETNFEKVGKLAKFIDNGG